MRGQQRLASSMVGLVGLLIMLSLSGMAGAVQPGGVSVVTNRDDVNIRTVPALGAPLVATGIPAGTVFTVSARSGDGEWYEVTFNEELAWVGAVVVTVLSGDVNALPVRDPRSIPYGGFDAPRAGRTSASSAVSGRLPNSGVRVRSGPSTAYIVLADAPRYTVFPVLGRTANGRWLQVNFEGTLGWVTAGQVEFLSGSPADLPIDGIVAEAPPLGDSFDDYVGLLRRLLERVEIAQASNERIRAIWTDAALGVVPVCGGYPPRPSNTSVPGPLRAAFAGQLNPILELFNTTMGEVRFSIDLLIETCQRPGAQLALVSAPVVTPGLEAANRAADALADLRRRIIALIPEIGPNDCLFVFSGRTDVLPIIGIGELVEASYDPRDAVFGFCVDLPADVLLRVELLSIRSNAAPRLAISPFDNPTAFLGSSAAAATGGSLTGFSDIDRGLAQQDAALAAAASLRLTTLGLIQIPFEGRYLLIVQANNPPNERLTGRYALLLTDLSGQVAAGPGLFIDEFGQVQIAPLDAPAVTVPLLPTVPSPGGVVNPGVPCPGVQFTCNQLLNCSEAFACFNAGNIGLDSNNNGIPCDEAPLFCTAPAGQSSQPPSFGFPGGN